MTKFKLFILMLATGAALIGSEYIKPATEKIEIEYTAYKGDTMWALASKAINDTGAKGDIREIIYNARTKDGTVNLRPGDKVLFILEVPTDEK